MGPWRVFAYAASEFRHATLYPADDVNAYDNLRLSRVSWPSDKTDRQVLGLLVKERALKEPVAIYATSLTAIQRELQASLISSLSPYTKLSRSLKVYVNHKILYDANVPMLSRLKVRNEEILKAMQASNGELKYHNPNSGQPQARSQGTVRAKPGRTVHFQEGAAPSLAQGDAPSVRETTVINDREPITDD